MVQGSTTLVKTLMESVLVDEFKFLIQPHIMRTSIGKLFEGMNNAFNLVNLKQLENGVVEAVYQPKAIQ